MSRRSFGHIRKLPSKKFQSSFVGLNGERVNAPYTFLTRSDASAWLSSEEVKQSKGIPQLEVSTIAPPALAKLCPIFETYVESHIRLQTNSSGSLLRESTKSLYRRLLRVNLRVFWGLPIDQITPSQISEWWATCVSSGKKTSASKAYKLLSASMRRAVVERLIDTNPCSVKGAQGAISGKSVGVPTLEEVKALANNINPRYKTMVLLMAFGGFRFGEVTELRRKDVNLIQVDGRRAYRFQVDRAVTLVSKGSSKSSHVVDKPKSAASIRNVVVTSALTELLDQLLESVNESENALLFPAASGWDVHLRHDVFMNSWRPALVRSGIAEGAFSPHGLRHFAGTHLHMAGATIAELKEWLGDSSTAAVMRYVHTTGRTPGIADKMATVDEFLEIA
jgi:integrase